METRLPDLPLSVKQLRSIVESGQARISVWAGAVRSGKTIASLIAFLIAVAAAPAAGRIVIVGRTLQTIERNIIEPLQEVALFGAYARLIHHTRGANTAVIMGRTVHLVGANDVKAEAKIRGMTCALAYVDEATVIPQSVWQMLLSRLSVPGARLLATTNPDSPAHWLRKDFLRRAGELRLASWRFTLDDNPSLDPGYVAALKAEYVGLWYRRFILGEWVAAEGAIYDTWDEGRHVVDILPPIGRWLALGVDYGTSNPFAAELVGIGDDGRMYVTAEWRYDGRTQRRQLTDLEYSERMRGWLATVERPHEQRRGVRPEWTIVDPSAASFVTQLHRDGLSPVLADNSVLDGIRTVSSLLASGRLKVHRSCAGLIAGIPGYSWDDRAAQRGEDKPVKIDDHECDALRYAVHTTQAAWRGQLAA